MGIMPRRKRQSYSNADATDPPTTSSVRGGVLPRRRLIANNDADPDYTLLHDLHGGAIGIVSMAWQHSLDRAVVLKRLPLPTAIAKGDALITEARICSHLNHPHIVTVHDLALDDDGQPFYVMRPVEGQRWSETLRLNAQRINVDILIKVCDAIDYAHAQGIIHRDLKPDNVMIGQHREVQVMDWGMAVGVPGNEHPAAPLLERHCPIAGTPAYMAPEMARGDGWLITTRSDIYLLGAILFEILTGAPPHEGTSPQEQVQAARDNRIKPTRVGGDLIDIALRAMASDPHDRHCSARALRDDIAHHDQRTRSRTLTTRAVLAFDRAAGSGDNHAFGQALFGFEEALELWPGNTMAQDYLRRTQCAYASFAIERGDLGLAASLLDGDDDQTTVVRHRLAEAKRQHSLDAEASQRLEDITTRRTAPTGESWFELCREDFNDDSWQSRWQVINGQASAEDGALAVPPAEPFVMLSRLSTGGDVRLEFDCELTDQGRICDISCLFDCRVHDNPRDCFTSGIEVKYACFDNSAVCCYQGSRLLHHAPCRPVAAGHVYHVVATHCSGQVRMTVDGEEVLLVKLPPSAPLAEHNRCGLFGWGADYRYRNLRLLVREPPMQADLLELAEHHLHRGRFATACDIFTEVDAGDDPQRAARLTLGQRQAHTLRRREDELDDYRRRITALWPGAVVSLCSDGLQVSLSYCGVDDLAPLADMPIARLDISGNAITDLGPLADMPLAQLNCSGNRIADLGPLRTRKLERLFCNGNLITDLSAITDMPLLSCDANYNQIHDLRPLSGMPLRNLKLTGNAIADLKPLGDLRLTSLYLSDNLIEDLTALATVETQYLHLANNRIVDLTPLRGHPATSIDLSSNRIEDLSPIADNALQRLMLSSNQLSDIGPVIDHPPPMLCCTDNPISDAQLEQLLVLWEDIALMHRNRNLLAMELALRHNDVEALRNQAQPAGDRAWLWSHNALPYDEAEQLARRLGGQLICLERPSLLARFKALHGMLPTCWLGLRQGDQHWANGAPLNTTLALPPWVEAGTPLLLHEHLLPQSRPDISAGCIIEWSAT